MENDISFITNKLRNTIKEMSARFLLAEEFPFEERGEELRTEAKNAMNVSKSNLEMYAFSLGGRSIENVLFALFEHSEANPDSQETARLLEILAYRMSKRLLEIIWQLYQFKYKDDNSNLSLILKMSVDYIEKEGLKTAEAEMLKIFYNDKGQEKAVEMLNGQSLPINSFASLYKFNLKSPMLKSIAVKYLEQCEKSVYPFNEAWMNRIISEVNYSKLKKLLINYLTCFSEEEYLESINISILDKIGYPYTSSDWGDIPDDLKRKFSNWNALRLLAEHFKTRTNKKYVLLSEYINYTKKVRTLREGQLLIVDFGRFVIADDVTIDYYSYLIEKSYYEKIKEELEQKLVSSFSSNNQDLFLEARDYIIEETESNVLQLDYRDVGKLYIKKTLNIMLELVMDSRPSKSILKAADLYFEHEFR